jgi:hypothetical protein
VEGASQSHDSCSFDLAGNGVRVDDGAALVRSYQANRVGIARAVDGDLGAGRDPPALLQTDSQSGSGPA